jgi:hypothetical protein
MIMDMFPMRWWDRSSIYSAVLFVYLEILVYMLYRVFDRVVNLKITCQHS